MNGSMLGFPVLYLQAMCLVTQLCLTLWNPMECSPPGSFVHGDSPGKNTGVGCHALLQGNLPHPGITPKSPSLLADSYHLSHQGSSSILEWVAYPFSRGSSPPRNWTRVSCIAGRFFTSGALISRSLLKFMCIESVMSSTSPLSHPLLPPSASALSLPQHQGLFQWVSSSHQVAKVYNKEYRAYN